MRDQLLHESIREIRIEIEKLRTLVERDKTPRKKGSDAAE
jgi:hypothetical protein